MSCVFNSARSRIRLIWTAVIGPLAAYLCREEAGFITGTDIVIDGGRIAE